VSADLACKAAGRFLESERRRIAVSTNDTVTLDSFSIIQTTSIPSADAFPLAYVHTLRPIGFIITSAHTGIRPIISFSYKGQFSLQDSPSNLLLRLLRRDMPARIRATENPLMQSIVQSNVNEWAQLNP